VTGANRGIGKAIVEGLAAQGLNVVLAGRDGAALGELAIGLHQQHGVETRALVMDVADPVSIQQGLAKLERNQVQIDVLINNAGILPGGDMLTMPWEAIEASTRVNALGPLQLMRSLIPGMAARRLWPRCQRLLRLGVAERAWARRLWHHQGVLKRDHHQGCGRSRTRRSGQRHVPGLGANRHGRRWRRPHAGRRR
jgi:NAD(P)-dependent dehydrogenase (short-subunit alcohol dehydrogenase family)